MKRLLLILLLATTAASGAELKRCDLSITRLNSTDSITRPGGATVVDDQRSDKLEPETEPLWLRQVERR